MTYRTQLVKRFRDLFALVNRGAPPESRDLTQKLLDHLVDFYAESAFQTVTYKINSDLSLDLHRKDPAHYMITCVAFAGFALKGHAAPSGWCPSKEVIKKFSPDFFVRTFTLTSQLTARQKEFVDSLWNPLSPEQKRLAIVATYKKIFSEFSSVSNDAARFFASICLNDHSPLLTDLASGVQPEPILVSATIVALCLNKLALPKLNELQLKIALTDTTRSLEMLENDILRTFHLEILSQVFQPGNDIWERLIVYASNVDDDLFEEDEDQFTKFLAGFLQDQNVNDSNMRWRELVDLLKAKDISKDLTKLIDPNRSNVNRHRKPGNNSLEKFWSDVERYTSGK